MLTPEWRKSSYSNGQASCVEVKGVWRKSTFSNSEASCIGVGRGIPDIVAVRDSKNPTGGMLTVTPTAWYSFTTSIKGGLFDL
jgi:hypothetical protein